MTVGGTPGVPPADDARPPPAPAEDEAPPKVPALDTQRRTYSGWIAWLCFGLAVTWSAFHIYTSFLGIRPPLQQRPTVYTFALVLIFLIFPIRRNRADKPRKVWEWLFDLTAIGATLWTGQYVFLNYMELAFRTGAWTTTDIVAAILGVMLVLEASRRTLGPVLPIVALCAIAYAMLGQHLPQTFAHTGYSVERISTGLFLGTQGIFGVPMAAAANIMIVFIIFAAVFNQANGPDLFVQGATSLFGRLRGGTAKAALVASGGFGLVSGSAVANVAISGPVTIPAMRKAGYSGQDAAAIEASASTGGQLLPPVMGAAAFVMAEFLNVNYLEVVAAALLPGLLYYVSLYAMVDFASARKGILGRMRDRPAIASVMWQRGHMIVPLIVLIALIQFGDWTAGRAAVGAAGAVVAVGVLRRATRIGPVRFLLGLRDGAMQSLEVVAACAAAGIVVGVVTLTGMGVRLSGQLTQIAGTNLLYLLVLTAIAATIMGMGVATTATYILVAILVAPSLVEMGIPPMAAHMFVFYFGIVATVTPPVALASYAAAAVARVEPIRCGFISMKYALAGYIVPFMVIYSPSLVAIGTPGERAVRFVTACFGVYGLAGAIQGYWMGPTDWLDRAVLAVGAVLLIRPGLGTASVGLTLLVAIGLRTFVRRRRLGISFGDVMPTEGSESEPGSLTKEGGSG